MVVPAKAGTHVENQNWAPAFAGATWVAAYKKITYLTPNYCLIMPILRSSAVWTLYSRQSPALSSSAGR